jgi:hypothetical protein
MRRRDFLQAGAAGLIGLALPDPGAWPWRAPEAPEPPRARRPDPECHDWVGATATSWEGHPFAGLIAVLGCFNDRSYGIWRAGCVQFLGHSTSSRTAADGRRELAVSWHLRTSDRPLDRPWNRGLPRRVDLGSLLPRPDEFRSVSICGAWDRVEMEASRGAGRA